MFDMDRNQSRQLFFSVWQKICDHTPLAPMEHLISEVIQLHPEYHAMLDNADSYQDKDYLPELGQTNPFLHMGLHIAIREQLSINQPPGIVSHYQRLMQSHSDNHAVEHMIMECLAQTLWHAQRNQSVPDNQSYLACLTSMK